MKLLLNLTHNINQKREHYEKNYNDHCISNFIE